MDKEINFSDIQETASEFRASAEIRKPVEKTAVSVRIDNDILEFFRKQGEGISIKH